MARTSLGKKLRFEIFKRDYFTCQYCGSQPPAVVLVCDHIEPVAAGGASTVENLITACESCNQGKGARRLSNLAVRPDADLMYLSVQQEIAEMHRYRDVMAEKDKAIKELVDLFQDRWVAQARTQEVPSNELLTRLLVHRSPEVVGKALEITANKIAANRLSFVGSGWVKYLHTVVRNLAEREGGA